MGGFSGGTGRCAARFSPTSSFLERLATILHARSAGGSMEHRLIRTAAIVSVLALAAGACDRKPAAPELQTTTASQPRTENITVAGCLKRGVLADNTFVLAASRANGAEETATYQVTGRDGVQLSDYVGQRVEVSGTLRAEEQTASTGGAEEKPKGTAGTPAVGTRTEIDVKRLEATMVKPTGDRCE